MHNMEINTWSQLKTWIVLILEFFVLYFLYRGAGVLHIRVLFYRKVLEMDIIRKKESLYSVFKALNMIVCKPFKLIW